MNNDSDTAEQMDEVNNNEMNDEDDSIDEISDEDLRRMKDNVSIIVKKNYSSRLRFFMVLFRMIIIDKIISKFKLIEGE